MKLNAKIINEIQPTGKEQEISDTGKNSISGLKLRVSAAGNKVFYLFYMFNGKKRKYKIGKLSGEWNLTTAREEAKTLKAKIRLGIDIQAERIASRTKAKTEKVLIFKTYLEEKYYPHTQHHQKSPGRTRQLIEHNFKFLMKKPINKITKWDIQKWQKEKLDSGIKPATINRAMTAIKACLNQAVKFDLIEKSPLFGMERLKGVSKGVVRYLTTEEEKRLLAALDKRDGYFPVFIKLLLNTGVRPGEALTLKWDAINFNLKQLVVHAAFTKGNKTRHIPLNPTVYAVLKKWKEKNDSDFVFPSYNETGHIASSQRVWKLVLKEANIKNFRLYDCRHSFASKLAMKGVEIYRISELLGHSSVEMTKVYAHLSPDYLSDAVNLIG